MNAVRRDDICNPLFAAHGYRVQVQGPSGKWSALRGGYWFHNGMYGDARSAFDAACARRDAEEARTGRVYRVVQQS